MDLKLKIAVAVVPYLAGGGVAFSLTMPAWTDYQTKVQAVDDKKHEQEDLQAKLSNKSRIQKEKTDLNKEIDSLRSSVPKNPELELLTIDLEKMCNESNCELLSIKQADAEALKKAGIEEQKKDTKKDDKNKKTSAGPDAGLAKMTMSVRVIGDYSNLMDLVRKLESYQRVVQISELKLHVPKAEKKEEKGKPELPDDGTPAEGDAQGDFHKLNSTLLVTAYYLP